MKLRSAQMTALLAFLLVGMVMPQMARAQLQEIRQTVFGMDCAPCAYAMEKSLGQVEGVETVSVSLNTGIAAIELRATNDVTYGTIRKVVADGGFAAKDATLKARGTVRRVEGRWILETPAGEQFVLQSDDETVSGKGRLKDLKPDQRVAVTGQIPASPETGAKRWTLRVQRVRPAA